MNRRLRSYLRVFALTCGVLTVLGGLVGCQSSGKFSDKELKQMQEGPPPEMPAEARKAMEGMNKGGGTSPPPRPKGQPGPGAPF
ncbi:MAG: hypothetical protein FJX72_01015 [Armatimonadetes bacterium]|nr:hypothetical protein [Armatimonadota bacterium]